MPLGRRVRVRWGEHAGAFGEVVCAVLSRDAWGVRFLPPPAAGGRAAPSQPPPPRDDVPLVWLMERDIQMVQSPKPRARSTKAKTWRGGDAPPALDPLSGASDDAASDAEVIRPPKRRRPPRPSQK